MATIPLMSPLVAVRMSTRNPIVGVDLSTVRASAAVIGGPNAPAMEWSTKTLQRHKHLGLRNRMAADDMGDWLEKLQADYGLPAAIGLEIPLAGGATSLASFWMIGAFYVAIGDVFSATVPVIEMNPGEWKKAATGSGYAPGVPRSALQGLSKSKAKERKREAEKARLVRWAQDVLGYPGNMSDEADAGGVCTATALRVLTRR